jgi:hypothetical protein
MFSNLNGSETMIRKKSDGNQKTSSRLSLASRLLGSGLRATLQVPPSEEAWRNKLQGKNKGKRHK